MLLVFVIPTTSVLMAGLEENLYEAPDRREKGRGATYILPESVPYRGPSELGYAMAADRIQPGTGWQRWVRPPMAAPSQGRYGSTDKIMKGNKDDDEESTSGVVGVNVQKAMLGVVLLLIIASIVACFIILFKVRNKPEDSSSSQTTSSAHQGMKCLASGGKCKDINGERCDGVFLPGMCPGKSNIRCCMESTRCSEQGGKCQNINTLCVAGKYKSNICPGSSDIRCCIPNARCTRNGGICNNIHEKICKGGIYVRGTEYCVGRPYVQCCFESDSCTAVGGKCQDKNATTCNGVYKALICPGPKDVQCCRTA